MKKWALFFVILFALMAGSALAEPQGDLLFDYGHGMLTVDVEGLTADSRYFLLVSRASDVSEATAAENLLFMDMVAANAEGRLNVGLVSMDIEEGACVYLGGIFEDVVSPYVVGAVEHNDYLALPSLLTSIEAEAFMGSGFTSVYIGPDVASIGDRAFKDCPALQTVTIANDSTTWGQDVFDGCGDVAIVCGRNNTAVDALAMLYDNITIRRR